MAERATELRERIVRAAADLLARGGLEAVSTRAVSAEAGVQAPAIYRQFGDMQKLLNAAARENLAAYVRRKALRVPSDDTLEELRHGWDLHVAFGLANPAAYVLLYGNSSVQAEGPERREGQAMLHAVVARIAEEGRLRVSVPNAAQLVHAGACGVTLSLIASPPAERDPRLSHAMRDAVLEAITVASTSKVASGPRRIAARAVALRAILEEAQGVLSSGEQQLLGEWLDRLASEHHGGVTSRAGARRGRELRPRRGPLRP